MNLAPGSRLRPFYEKQPFYLHFLAYVFNVTNKDEVIQGSELNSQSNEFLQMFFTSLNIQLKPLFLFSFHKKNQNFKKSVRIFLSE